MNADEMTERQRDQAWIENERAENLRRANGVKAIDPGGCAPPVYVAERSRLDEAVEVAAKALFEDQCPEDRWSAPMDEDERQSWRDGARKVLLAGVKVLLGEPVGWQYLSDGKWISVGEPMANVSPITAGWSGGSTPPAWEKVMSRHTAGPWTHGHDGHGAFSIETDDCDGVQICYVRNEANARLIAAAPDLLEALEMLWREYKALADSGDAGFWSAEDTPEGIVALAAIARATQPLPTMSEDV